MNSQGVQKRAELDRHWGRATVDRAVREGRLIVVARGWYALPDASSDVLRAIRLGGRLDCVSAAQHHGLWVPD
ncbi:MAG: hypothetical protein L0G99_11685, partial [Propionibacteriales bacterium]|nr:hypothetical protein [Propionibacteriales bacterium]